MAKEKGGLLNFLIIGVVLLAVGTTYVHYTTSLIDEADKITRHAGMVQFKRTLIAVRAKWIRHKQREVVIYDTRVSGSGDIGLNKKSGHVVILNDSGWPQGMHGLSGKACEQLLQMANLQQITLLSDVYVDDFYQNGMLYCTYHIKGKFWFSYSAATGDVSEVKF